MFAKQIIFTKTMTKTTFPVLSTLPYQTVVIYPKKSDLHLHTSKIGVGNLKEKKKYHDLFAFLQLETKTGKAAAATLSATDALEPPDLKVALKREREEHQHLLAESYAAVMDLTKQVNVRMNKVGLLH